MPSEKSITLVFVIRQSPDWSHLAQDYAEGAAIDPARYKPPMFIEGFPGNIEECIAVWNRSFTKNFYHCRAVLKTIASNLLKKIPFSIIISEHETSNLSVLVGDKEVMLFFMDDDDWFAPDTFERVSRLSLGSGSIAVFPLVRFDTDTFTFVRQHESASVVIGNRQNFNFRFQTNNYCLGRTLALSDNIISFKDHVVASKIADSLKLEDCYFDLIISATNKTPCSASKLPGLVVDPAGYIQSMREYVMNLKSLQIPDEISWCKEPLAETVALFEAVLDSAQL